MGIWSGIKYAINSSVGTSQFEALDTTIGKRSDSAGVSTANSMFGWVKNIWNYTSLIYSSVVSISSTISTINTNSTKGVIKSVQRGSCYPGVGSFTYPISAVVMSKAVLYHLGSTLVSNTSSSYDGPPRVASIILSSSTGITFNVPFETQNVKGEVSWQLVEYY